MTRKLSKSDQEIWDHVRTSVTPIRDEFEKADVMEALDRLVAPRMVPRRVSQKTDIDAVMPSAGLEGMMKSTRRQVTRGQMDPTAKLDLHGMRLDDARHAFKHFLNGHVKAGHKMLLIVTGKGGHARQTDFGVEVSGVIKRAFPDWVHDAENGRQISHFCPAHIRHGGDGAFYVFTRARARR